VVYPNRERKENLVGLCDEFMFGFDGFIKIRKRINGEIISI
jgi:hypothetical protein